MNQLIIIILTLMLPAIAFAELYEWIDSNGVVNYSSTIDKLPDNVRSNTAIRSEVKSVSAGNKNIHDENSQNFINETVEKISVVLAQIEQAMPYVDEYHGKNRSISKSDLLSYFNSLSYEIRNLKDMERHSSLKQEAKNALRSRISEYESKYIFYNKIINDFDSIEVTNLKWDKQIDIKTIKTLETITINNASTVIRNVDPNTTILYSNTEENYIFTFSATITNTGSKADVSIILSGLNFAGVSVTTHLIKTSIGSETRKEIGDRIILTKVGAQDISRWEISDVKIVRRRK